MVRPPAPPDADERPTLIIGAGLIGLCSAHFLSRAGHRVRVIERRDDVALETSFANAGMLTPSMAGPWNAPGVLWDLLRWIGRSQAPLLVRPRALAYYAGWGLKFLRHSAPGPHRHASEANYRLSAFSLEELRNLRESLALEYDARTHGTLTLFRDAHEFAQARAEAGRLGALGLASEILDRDGVAAAEPLLADARDAVAGGIRHPGDETGDARTFCLALRDRLEADGVAFELGTRVQRIEAPGGEVRAVITDRGSRPAQRVVVAAAAWSVDLLAPLGIRLPVRPVKGYSVTARVDDPALMPRGAIIDHSLHAAVTPLGERLRIAGTAEFGGWDARLDPARIQNLWDLARAINPRMADACDRRQAQAWCGFRPMSADGKPYVGATPIRGLYVNTGHGPLGWTQAAGSGRLLAQIMAGEAPAIPPEPYSATR